jgi:hypothetical protein
MPDVCMTLLAGAFRLCEFTTLDYLGCVASACVLLTFCMQSMFQLRLTALLSNFAFIAYGWVGRLMPILILHCMLLLINSIGLAYALINWRSVASDQSRTPAQHRHISSAP